MRRGWSRVSPMWHARGVFLLGCITLAVACGEEAPEEPAADMALDQAVADMAPDLDAPDSGLDQDAADMGLDQDVEPDMLAPDMALDMASDMMMGPDLPPSEFGYACFTAVAGRQAGIYEKDSRGGAARLVEACAPEWGCSADLTECASAERNAGAVKVCRDDLISVDGASRTYGRIVWRSELAGSNQMWPILEECPENTPVCAPDGSLSCATSLKDEQSPWAKFACPTKPELELKTGLDTDCRCGINQVAAAGLPQCQRLTVVADRGVSFGQGPQVGREGALMGGFADAASRQLIIAGNWSNASGKYGILWSVNMDSGDRRVLSGAFMDPTQGFAITTVGAGESFNEPYNVQRGPDGNYYVADNLLTGNMRILRVDATTGDRTVVWDSRDLVSFGYCPHRSTVSGTQNAPAEAIRTRTFAMDAQGNFYLANQPGNRGSGPAILRISPDGQTCADVTRSGASGTNGYNAPGESRGGGYLVAQGDYSALSVQGDKIYAVNMVNSTLIEVDIATGDRRLISAAGSSMRVGAGPTGRDGVPNWYTMPDPADPNFVWVVGDSGKTVIVRIDKRTGDRFPISPELNQPKWERFVHGPMFVGNLGPGGMWFDPADPNILYFAHDQRGVVKAELDTKNNRILSL